MIDAHGLALDSLTLRVEAYVSRADEDAESEDETDDEELGVRDVVVYDALEDLEGAMAKDQGKDITGQKGAEKTKKMKKIKVDNRQDPSANC
uniref:Polyprotein protein n=1 Tax=Solanum tuberosum TaxID=4113 RepID=M1DBN9_SOLTU